MTVLGVAVLILIIANHWLKHPSDWAGLTGVALISAMVVLFALQRRKASRTLRYGFFFDIFFAAFIAFGIVLNWNNWTVLFMAPLFLYAVIDAAAYIRRRPQVSTDGLSPQ
jgi:hypothetical protein